MHGREETLFHGVVEQAQQAVEIARNVQHAAGFRVEAQLRPGHDFEQLLEGAEPAWQGHEGIGQLHHARLALVHRVDDLQLAQTFVGHLRGYEREREHPRDPRTRRQRGVRERAHQPHMRPAVHDLAPAPGDRHAEILRGCEVLGVRARAGACEDTERVDPARRHGRKGSYRGPAMNESEETARRGLWLAGVGAAAGILLASVGLLRGSTTTEGELAPGVVALVNGTPISADDYARLVAAVEQDTRSPVDDGIRRRVLDRMIEEELLVQRALDLGLARMDRQVRANLTGSLIQSIVNDAEDREPEAGELEAFYAENGDFFSHPGRLRVRQIFFPVTGRGEGEARAEAQQAIARLRAGEPFAQVKEELGGVEISPVPDVLLPALKLREYLGPTALRSARELEIGEISEPVRSGTGVHVLQLTERERARAPAFKEVEAQVLTEWRRRLGSAALREYLDELREESEITIDPTRAPGSWNPAPARSKAPG